MCECVLFPESGTDSTILGSMRDSDLSAFYAFTMTAIACAYFYANKKQTTDEDNRWIACVI